MSEFVVKKHNKRKYIQHTVRIEENLFDKLKEVSERNNLPSFNEFINDCLRFSMNNLKELDIKKDK